MRDCCQDRQWTASRCFMYEAGYIVCCAFHIRSLAVHNSDYNQELFRKVCFSHSSSPQQWWQCQWNLLKMMKVTVIQCNLLEGYNMWQCCLGFWSPHCWSGAGPAVDQARRRAGTGRRESYRRYCNIFGCTERTWSGQNVHMPVWYWGQCYCTVQQTGKWSVQMERERKLSDWLNK